jgi:hypothetical protein
MTERQQALQDALEAVRVRAKNYHMTAATYLHEGHEGDAAFEDRKGNICDLCAGDITKLIEEASRGE